jgi:hypothetical protein
MKSLLYTCVLLLSIPFTTWASSGNFLVEENTDSIVQVLNAEAISLCKGKKYQDAERKFKQLFKTKNAILPDEAAYYFGVTSFYLKKYGQAKKAFHRFETLSLAPDSLKKESIEFRYDIDCYEKGYFEYLETCIHCEGLGEALEDCHVCKGNGRQYCPTCSGSGVAVVRSSMGGENYSTCSRCGGKGVIDCQTCKGTLKEHKACSVCKGKGKVTMKGVCADE